MFYDKTLKFQQKPEVKNYMDGLCWRNVTNKFVILILYIFLSLLFVFIYYLGELET